MRRAAVIFLVSDFASLLGNSAVVLVLPYLVLLRTGMDVPYSDGAEGGAQPPAP